MDGFGFFNIKMELDVLFTMEISSQAILFLGLIFDIIILMFILLSILLIYSLLIISVESKTFEFGILRMVGLSKSGIIYMILIQSFMFVVPSVLTGFLVAYPSLYYINKGLFSDDMGIDITPHPSAFAITQSLVVGLIIPFISSIIPIQNALSKNLNDSLDLQRSKASGMYVDILDQSKANMTSYVIFGVIGCAYGISIYYLLPLSMLSFNYGMILKIFFFILLGMLFGLSLLAFNIQRFLEIILTYILLCFERKSMKMMVLKNLEAHRPRNKMTSLIYSISLGYIIFNVVSYNLQVKTVEQLTLNDQGSFL